MSSGHERSLHKQNTRMHGTQEWAINFLHNTSNGRNIDDNNIYSGRSLNRDGSQRCPDLIYSRLQALRR
jgi:hypothetical protein